MTQVTFAAEGNEPPSDRRGSTQLNISPVDISEYMRMKGRL